MGGTKALHTCFGYAAIVHEKPNGYPFLAELDSCPADEISIEAAQPRLDPSLLEQLPSKRVILGVLDLNDMEVESAEIVADRIRAALDHIDPERLMVGPDCGMKYLPREVARGKLRSLVEGAGARSRRSSERAGARICFWRGRPRFRSSPPISRSLQRRTVRGIPTEVRLSVERRNAR